jgi:hypothetical protein
MDLAREFVRLAGLEEGDRDEETTGPGPSPPPPPPPSGQILRYVAHIMERERWLAFDRLCARVVADNINATPGQVYDCLRADPLCEKTMVYPVDSSPLEGPGIVIWTAEA